MEIVTGLVVLCVFGVLLLVLVPYARSAERTLPEFDGTLERVAEGRLVECVCGRLIAAGGPDHHLVARTFPDDWRLAGGPLEGGTAMVADFCPDDCPGGCDQGCPIRAKP